MYIRTYIYTHIRWLYEYIFWGVHHCQKGSYMIILHAVQGSLHFLRCHELPFFTLVSEGGGDTPRTWTKELAQLCRTLDQLGKGADWAQSFRGTLAFVEQRHGNGDMKFFRWAWLAPMAPAASWCWSTWGLSWLFPSWRNWIPAPAWSMKKSDHSYSLYGTKHGIRRAVAKAQSFRMGHCGFRGAARDMAMVTWSFSAEHGANGAGCFLVLVHLGTVMALPELAIFLIPAPAWSMASGELWHLKSHDLGERCWSSRTSWGLFDQIYKHPSPLEEAVIEDVKRC